jgi:hypothetical protein
MLRLKRHLGSFTLAVLTVPLLAALVLLLPILLPAALAAEALTVRRLARTRCAGCGSAIGLAEIGRAKLEARAKARGIVGATLALGRRPRVAVPWEVRCSACGQAYDYRPDAAPGLVARM